MKKLKHILFSVTVAVLTFIMTFSAAGCNPPPNKGNDDTPDGKHTITYISDGATYITQEYTDGDLSEEPEQPKKDNYCFDAWYESSVYEGTSFVFGEPVTRDITLYAKWTYTGNVTPPPDGKTEHTVTVDWQDGTNAEVYTVNHGEVFARPSAGSHALEGYMLTGFVTDKTSNTKYDFSKTVISDLTLYATWEKTPNEVNLVGAYNESIYVTWQETTPSNAKVYYKSAAAGDWLEVDAPLVRAISGNEARVDVLGLSAGEYEVKIKTSGNTEITLPAPIPVSAYDRSGYAHFNYDKGVGAYKDNGTIKDGTLVIYVTEENKNDVLDSAYVDGKKVNISQFMDAKSASSGVTLGQQKGIGELLNNRRYAGNDRMNVGIAALCNEFGSVAIRIIGKVSAEVSGTMDSSIKGLTTYNSTENGGSVGDNGRMARMVNAHDLTIEGVGDDASIFGWGVHFIASDVLHKYERAGKGFEVRNITFANYPEDAVGMEGIQGDKWDENGSITSGASSTSADLPSPVERCWVHNNTFLPGYASNPAESDKKEGDGSCDFKRGYGYTLSYNYFEGCHKTNLIGSSDSSLQFDITIHHNWWYQCGSRIPLVRNANLHYYNNYVSGDMSATPKPGLSYVVSARGSAYMFSEANYFDGCKNIVKEGVVKSYNDVLYADFGNNVANVVSSRDEYISNSCKFSKRSIDYSHFDTNPAQFYYKDGKSDCLLDDAVTARQKAMMYAGANGHGVADTAVNKYTPTSGVSVPESGITVSLPTAKSDTEVNGVLFRGLTGVASGTIKFKGQGITFTLTAEAQLTVTTTTVGDQAPELIDSNGAVYAHKFEGTLTIVLQAGTYVIASGQKEKESVISLLKFDDTSASSAARVQAAVDAINALAAATPALSDAYEGLLNTARAAYGALTHAEKSAFDSAIYAKLQKAIADFGGLQVAEFERLVNLIGTVNENSYNAINAAQQAYDRLSGDLRQQVASAKAKLDEAWAAYEKFAVINVINLIDAFAAKVNADSVNESTARDIIEALISEGNSVMLAYEALSDEAEEGASQQAQVTNYTALLSAIDKLENINKLFAFKDELEYFEDITVTLADAGKIASMKAHYEALSETQKSLVTPQEKALYDSVLKAYEDLASQTIESDFSGENGKASNSFFTVSNNTAKNASFHINGLGGKDFTRGLKIESKTQITFTTTTKMTLTLYVDAANKILIDGKEVAATQNADGDFVVVITLEAGAHNIAKKDSMNLWYATLTPAS